MKERRQRNKNLLMGMGVVIVVLLIVLAVVLIKKKDASMPVSFDLTTEVFGQTVEEEALTADGLAADLCGRSWRYGTRWCGNAGR